MEYFSASLSSSSSSSSSSSFPRSSPLTPHPLRREDFDYASCYCEENCYKLIIRLAKDRTERYDGIFCIFITSKAEATPFWFQKTGPKDVESPVLWDYHVIVLMDELVFDLDSSLDFPCTKEEYFAKSVRPELSLKEKHEHIFRVIHAQQFLDHFSSDRSHMSSAQVSPPSWPPIIGPMASSQNTFPLYRYMNEADECECVRSTNAEIHNAKSSISRILDLDYGIVLNRQFFLLIFSS